MSLAGTVTKRLRRNGFRKGVLGSSRVWLGLWVVLATARLVRRFTGHKPEVVFKGEVKEGEALLVAHGGEVTAVRATAAAPSAS